MYTYHPDTVISIEGVDIPREMDQITVLIHWSGVTELWSSRSDRE